MYIDGVVVVFFRAWECFSVCTDDKCVVDVVFSVTEYQNHAMAMVETYDLSTIEGISTVGGDGLFYEVAPNPTSRTRPTCAHLHAMYLPLPVF